MPSQEVPRLRRSPHVVMYWKSNRLVFHNYLTATYVGADALTVTILDFLGTWRSIEEVCGHFQEYSASSVQASVQRLTELSFLDHSDREATTSAMDSWQDWAPAGAFFHFATKNMRPLNVTHLESEERLSDAIRSGEIVKPPVSKEEGDYPIALPAPRRGGQFCKTLLARRTWRIFGRRAVRVDEIATILGLTWGIQGWTNTEFGRAPLKTSPSGGGCHPIEVYLVAAKVTGLAPAIYHYSASQHRLRPVVDNASSRTLERYVPGQWWYHGAAAVVLMTVVFPRKQWRYHFPRAYRSVLLEAGHFCQTFCLVATWLGLAPFCTAALQDSVIEHDLGIDGVGESVIYAAGVGARSAGPATRWPSSKKLGAPSDREG